MSRFWVFLCGAAAVIACRSSDSQGRTVLVDDLGHRVSLDAPARRIVSLAPAVTELLFAIGAGHRLAGRTRWCEYPPEAEAIPSVGDGLFPNVEIVAAREPDLVVMYASNSNATVIEQFSRMGIPALNVRFDALSDVPRAARILGEVAGRGEHADSLALHFEAWLDSTERAVRRQSPTRAAVVAWESPPIIIGAGSFLTELIRLAGGRNVFDDVDSPSATVSIETIASRNPDRIIAIGRSAVPELADRPEWQAVDAVNNREFIAVSGTEFGWPSFRSIGAVETLRGIFQGGGSP